MQIFADRHEAGRALGSKLTAYAHRPDVVVLGLPRGGVPVAFEVARMLAAPLDVFTVRKLGVPGNEELAMGAIASGGTVVLNHGVIESLGIQDAVIDRVVYQDKKEIDRRERLYRKDREPINCAGRTVVLVDDGLATGATMAAAAKAIQGRNAARVIIAAPVAAPSIAESLRDAADELVFVDTPQSFFAIGEFYADFTPATDEEVKQLLGKAVAADEPSRINIEMGDVTLAGDLIVPPDARGIVLFAHGSGSGRHSPRNRFVARTLSDGGFATLLVDLLTEEEEKEDAETADLRFDIGLLAKRLLDATDWVSSQAPTQKLSVGYFGASTGAAAALMSAAEWPDRVGAVVSRGGRPDMAESVLWRVRVPTLLIVGGDDPLVLDLNRRAHAELACEKRLEIVPGATHLFEEPGMLEQVADLALDWFEEHLGSSGFRPRRRRDIWLQH
jgi:predicted phosphoribosyltransferase/dienelactone hydrolase